MEKYWPLYKQLQASLNTEPDLLRSAFKWRWQTASSGRQPGLFITPTSWWHLPDETGRENVLPEKKKTERAEKRGWAPLLSPGRRPVWHAASPGNAVSDLDVCPVSALLRMSLCRTVLLAPLSRPGKFRTWAQTCSAPGRGTWLGERGIEALSGPTVRPSWRLASGGRPAECHGGARGRYELKRASRRIWDVLIVLIQGYRGWQSAPLHCSADKTFN